MKKIFKYLFYASLLFLVIYLYKLDYFVVPTIISYQSLFLSFFLLLLGFFFQILNWQDSLRVIGLKVSLMDAYLSTGLSTFMKYIPGKVLAVMGRATYISNKYGASLKLTTTASAVTQLLTLFVGSILGAVFIVFFQNDSNGRGWLLGLFCLLLVFSLVILGYNYLRKIIFYISSKLKRKFILPKLKLGSIIRILPFFILRWLSWSVGFLFLVYAFIPDVSYGIIFAFPLASVLGILAIFSPGGIGVREGALAVCLIAVGVDEKITASIVVSSRLWFLIGDSLVFASVFLFKKGRLKN